MIRPNILKSQIYGNGYDKGAFCIWYAFHKCLDRVAGSLSRYRTILGVAEDDEGLYVDQIKITFDIVIEH